MNQDSGNRSWRNATIFFTAMMTAYFLIMLIGVTVLAGR